MSSESDQIEKLSDVSTEDDEIADMVLDGPLYYILGQFLETNSHKNVATLLEELVDQLKDISLSLKTIASSKSSSS